MNLSLLLLGFFHTDQGYTSYEPKEDHSSPELKGIEMKWCFNAKPQKEIDVLAGLVSVLD